MEFLEKGFDDMTLVLWKRLNTETDPKVTLGPFPSFFKNYWKSFKNWKRLRDFRIFLIGFRYIYIWFVSRFFIGFRIFLGLFSVLKTSLRFSENILNSQYVEPFSLFFDPFLHFLGLFPFFRKSFKFSVCWPVSSYFGSVSGFQKKFQILRLLIGFLFFGSVSSFFG